MSSGIDFNFDLTGAELAAREKAREFASRLLKPGAAERDAAGVYPHELYLQLGKEGFAALPYPEAEGGMGNSWLSAVLATEELARVDASFAMGYLVTADLSNLLFLKGTAEQKERWFKPLIEGKNLAAFGLTEFHAGSDVQNMHTTAVLEGDFWVLNGQKAYITNSGSPISLFVCVFCHTGNRPDGKKEFSAILVPNGTPGVTVFPRENKLGLRSADMHRLEFSNCQVPASHLIGPPGEGLHLALGILEFGRVLVAAAALGLAQACLDECLRYAKERQAFGAALSHQPAIQQQVAEIATEVSLARLATYQATRCYEQGRLSSKEASMVKLFASEVCQRAAVFAVDLFGAAGFMNESPVARYYRDAKAMTIVEGTSNIQRLIIARQLGVS